MQQAKRQGFADRRAESVRSIDVELSTAAIRGSNSMISHGKAAKQRPGAEVRFSPEELDGAIANIGRSAKTDQPSISLGTTPLVAANILPPAMREFRKQRPGVRIQLFDADLPVLIKMVEAGKRTSNGARPPTPSR